MINGVNKSVLLNAIVISTAVGVTADGVQFRRRQRKKMRENGAHVPMLLESKSGCSTELEKFSHYVARQMGFKDMNECPNLCKLANDHLKKTKGHEESIFAFFANEPNAEVLTVKFIEEIDRCIMSYFAFHWDHATNMITQILNDDCGPKRKFRSMVLEATRKLRFERVLKELKVTRIFSTILEELKAIGMTNQSSPHGSDVMVPAAHKDRRPVLLLMGGGMGAGKSTVLKAILKDAFWSEAGKNAVVVEADAFKESDVFFRAISSRGHHNDMLQTAELVHQSSTDAASSLLVTALNEGRDVIMDGTLSWEPFVSQTISMARNIHSQRYRMGLGYKVQDDGTITEDYWEPVGKDGEDSNGVRVRKPYRIELVGVVSDVYLAVVRGIRRAIMTGRAVRVKNQLRSHKSFANAFHKYCKLVDGARLFSTNSSGPPKLIGCKCEESELLVDPKEIGCLDMVRTLNEEASSVHELYPDGSTVCGSHSVFDELVLCPKRVLVQQELRNAIEEIESRTTSQQ
ncbi:hypothetical protein LUZ60_001492 [Juncus effusus]|nr:hypothetical protein LUZ60_001492 [Juncus effusus]